MADQGWRWPHSEPVSDDHKFETLHANQKLILELLSGIANRLDEAANQRDQIMAAIDDLNSADLEMTSEVALVVKAIADLDAKIVALNAAIAAGPAANDPAIAKAAADLTANINALKSALPAPSTPVVAAGSRR